MLYPSDLENWKSFVHELWRAHLTPSASVLDATFGNGHDTAFLLGIGVCKIYAVDIQLEAILKAESHPQLELIHGSHAELPSHICNLSLAVYNLGYLPGGNKSITTTKATTLVSLQDVLTRLLPGGLVTVTCYPGHAEGALEEEALLQLAKQLDKSAFSVTFHQWINREKAPSLLVIKKSDDIPKQHHLFTCP